MPAETILKIRQALPMSIGSPTSKIEEELKNIKETTDLQMSVMKNHPVSQIADVLQLSLIQNKPGSLIEKVAQVPQKKEIVGSVLPNLGLVAKNLPPTVLKLWKDMFYGLPAAFLKGTVKTGYEGWNLAFAAGQGEEQLKKKLKELGKDMTGGLEGFARSLYEINKPYIEAFSKPGKQSLRNLSREIEKDPASFILNTTLLMQGGSLGIRGLGGITKVAGKVTGIRKVQQAGKVLNEIAVVAEIRGLGRKLADSIIAIPAEDVAKIPLAGAPISKAFRIAKKSRILNQTIKMLESDMLLADRLDVVKQFGRGNEILSAFKGLAPSEISEVVRALEGQLNVTKIRTKQGKALRLENISETISKFSPQMKEAYKTVRAHSLADEAFLKTYDYYPDRALELRRYAPVMESLKISLDKARTLFPQEYSPVYWRHQMEKAQYSWRDFMGLGEPVSLSRMRSLSESQISFTKRMRGDTGYIRDNPLLIAMSQMQRVRIQNAVERVFDFTKKYGEPFFPGDEVKLR